MNMTDQAALRNFHNLSNQEKSFNKKASGVFLPSLALPLNQMTEAVQSAETTNREHNN